MAQAMLTLAAQIAKELQVQVVQVEKTIGLLDEGATVPFIARYRKEVTGELDDRQLRFLEERLHYLRELEARRQVILKSIQEQDKLDPLLEEAILLADSKTRLEDLYLPYRPKRRSKAQTAREAGLEPLAEHLLAQPGAIPEEAALAYINPDAAVTDAAAALEGARQILMERFAEDATVLQQLRQTIWRHGILQSTMHKAAQAKNSKFSDYFDYKETLHKIPSHRALALFRGRREGSLRLELVLPEAIDGPALLARHFQLQATGTPRDQWLQEVIQASWKIKILSKLELELMASLREKADEEATRVFAKNLRDLLLAAPAGAKVTLGLDPGMRSGVKAVVVDHTGKLLDYATVFPLAPQNEWHQSLAELAKMAAKHQVSLVSIGNGTGSRETERLVSDLMRMYPDLALQKVVVSEAGASVYSASELASHEFPELDVTVRGAVSIARRLQDPLAELVKIDPKSIGVGQYQHDVNQSLLARSLEAVVEDCVNAVGVDVNMASVPLLARVAGLNESVAKNIVEYRDAHGPFANRQQLLAVPRMGDKTFQQAAGFLRIHQGDNPLDASSVHPEAYPLVERILRTQQWEISTVIGDSQKLRAVNAAHFVDEQFGLPTIQDILKELEKPGRDPRPLFKTAQFKEGVEEIKDLEKGMILEGVVSNVTNFGAFVDVGVHQDGLVHISEMTRQFIDDPHKLVKAGDIVQVKVLDVDVARRRISLTMILEERKAVNRPARSAPVKSSKNSKANATRAKTSSPPKARPKAEQPLFNTAMADALAKLKQGS
ncbi:MAG: RNA-binding transcriptional accessory protein [Legionellaceae bacterium]|nr:RNA-binding transcriptional accessory protein [Legionellaceae bacterium]